ncbi:MAG: isoaspartyl peptidase/L-asparaginase [Flavobacteriaceae bacterium]|nr:isoaspartyl peptidase/L-asparaginase [Flavobacteriaceae bacterium]
MSCNRPIPEAPKAVLVIHGGAGWISRESVSDSMENAYIKTLEAALIKGRGIIKNGGSSLDAVQLAIEHLEDSPLFNAGKGSVFTYNETNEMDSAIMNGATGDAGAATGISTIKNPIQVARAVLDHSVHVFLSGQGAEEFAVEQGLKQVDPSYFFTQKNFDRLKEVKVAVNVPSQEKLGTVGAVALDVNGNLAAGTSTGGMTNKRYGRIGDVPVIGAGTYAENDVCGISATGHGEFFIRNVVAHDIAARMKYAGHSIEKASTEVIAALKEKGGAGGVIGLDSQGHVVMPFNTPGMFRGYISLDGSPVVAIYAED